MFGASLGGLIAVALAAATPARVDRLVVSGTAARLGSAELWNGRIDAVKRGGLAGLADAVLARWTSPEFAVRAPAEAAGLRAMLLATSADGYAAGCAAVRDADLGAALRSGRRADAGDRGRARSGALRWPTCARSPPRSAARGSR